MFRNLPSLDPSLASLKELAKRMLEPPEQDDPQGGGDPKAPPSPAGDYPTPNGGNGAPNFDNPDIPAGYTYLGQFIDHDITFDPVSSLQRQNDPDSLHDFRTPRFDLDSVYGAGPNNDPFMYDAEGVRLLLGENSNGDGDLPRSKEGRAIIGDPRNDENVIVSQLQLLFLRFHNKVVDRLEQDGSSGKGEILFLEAQRLVRWHYQWIVVHDFLRRRIVGQQVIDDILKPVPYRNVDGTEIQRPEIVLRFYSWNNEPFMPVEFSAAAYRFGHSMIRPDYRISTQIPQDIPIFKPHAGEFEDLHGFRPLPKNWTIDWSFFFETGDPTHLQQARLIDSKLADPLNELPGLQPASLPLRNLERGRSLGLPSGQRVAGEMGIPLLATGELGLDEIPELQAQSPLWFYVLKESEVRTGGHKLGPVGARIVSEVLLGLLKGDPFSFIRVEPLWTPTLPGATPGDFTMADLVQFAAT
jgi:hypothetical protein